MVYAAKPQRGGKSIRTNTNNPPQDPPPPPIENPVTPIAEIPQKVSWFRKSAQKIKGVFGRK